MFIFIMSLIKQNNKYFLNEEEIEILNLCGEGSNGVVYECKYLGKMYVVKFSNNEKPETLKQRYQILKNVCVRHVIFGEIENDKYKYFSIMKNGGVPLKHYKINETNFKVIVSQLHDIIEYIKNNKIIYSDLKVSNVVVHEDVVKLIDIYMDCSDCKNNLNCRIVRTFKTVDLTLKMHETPAYNYSYIYPLYGYILLELTNNSLMKLCKKFNEEYDLKLKYKKIAFLFQLSILYTHKKEYEEYIHEELKKCLTLNKKYLKKIYTFFFDNIESSIKDFKKILFYLFIPVPELRRNIKFC